MIRRLLLSYLTITIFALLVLEIPLGVFVASLQRERLASDLQRDAMVLATLYEDALDNREPYSPEPAAEYAARTGGRVVVVDADGISIVDTEDNVNRSFASRPEIQRALQGLSADPDVRYSETLGRDILFVSVPVASGGEVHGAVRITFDPEEVDEAVRSYWIGLVGIGLVVLAAVAAVGWIIARSVTRPLEAMHEAARAAGAGDLSVRIDPGEAPVEVRDLAEAFNTMAGRLADLLERQRAFVADASHELRTPLTALRLRLENLESGLDDDMRQDLAAALAESERLAELVDQLLLIARTESRVKPAVRVDLAATTRDRADLWSAVAEERGMSVEVNAAGEVWVSSVPGGVEQILDNLVSNALAVSAPGEAVEVSATATPEGGRLAVLDHGPGLSAEQKERAFDRFWRADQNKPGTGLGLAIVQELVQASGGRVSLTDAPGGGLVASVVLPAPEGDVSRL